MNDTALSALLAQLLALPKESEWVEFKHNASAPDQIAGNISALANAAALHNREVAYIVWGIEDGTHEILGTDFDPKRAKKGNEELENWLIRSLYPQVDLRFYRWIHRSKPVVMCEIPRATNAPVRFGSEAFIRVGSLTKKLKDYHHKERNLWKSFDNTPFEKLIAKADVSAEGVISLIDFATFSDLLATAFPTTQTGILEKLAEEGLIVSGPEGRFDITNLGAILFAKDLKHFDWLDRKRLRILKYRGRGRTSLEREWRDAPSGRGYALAFEPAVAFINSQLPQNEPIGQAFRAEVRMYPEIAIRELVANALIHQDFAMRGTGPIVEIFDDRMEISNPGEPLIDTLRFIDAPPRSRNEALAKMMRRMKICEEAGSGIDKVVESVELFQLPAPDFSIPPDHTKVTLLGPQTTAIAFDWPE